MFPAYFGYIYLPFQPASKPEEKPEIRYVVPGADENNPPMGGVPPGVKWPNTPYFNLPPRSSCPPCPPWSCGIPCGPYQAMMYGSGYFGTFDEKDSETCTMKIVPPELHPRRGMGMNFAIFRARVITVKLGESVGDLLEKIGGLAKEKGVTRIKHDANKGWEVMGVLPANGQTKDLKLKDMGCKKGEVIWLAQGIEQ